MLKTRTHTASLVSLEPTTPPSRVKHSKTEPMRSGRKQEKHGKLPSMQRAIIFHDLDAIKCIQIICLI